jgi:hypothetical protein
MRREREILDHLNSAIRCLEDAKEAIRQKSEPPKRVNLFLTRAKEYIVEARSDFNEKE